MASAWPWTGIVAARGDLWSVGAAGSRTASAIGTACYPGRATMPTSVAALAPCPHCGQTHAPTILRCPETDMLLPLEGRRLDGRFSLIRCIGRGGMASVWLARNERVDRHVAIKLIRPEVARDDELVARFRAEARAAGRIGHANICDILDSGRSPIGPYIVMEFLKGRSLGELVAGGERLPPAVAVPLVREALRGLQAAHRAGIVHRDLKPENLFLHCPPGAEPIVKLMDFGVAKFTDGTGETQTQHGALLGTPEYMAPEQFRGAAFAEPRTDLWAMGAILYRVLGGRNAFGGPTVAATLLMVSSEEPRPLHTLAPDLPPGLGDIVARCLRKDPDQRFADVAALDEALAAFDPGTRDFEALRQRALAGEPEPPPKAATSGDALTRQWDPHAPDALATGAPAPKTTRMRWWGAAAIVGLGGVAAAIAWRSRADDVDGSAQAQPRAPTSTDAAPAPDTPANDGANAPVTTAETSPAVPEPPSTTALPEQEAAAPDASATADEAGDAAATTGTPEATTGTYESTTGAAAPTESDGDDDGPARATGTGEPPPVDPPGVLRAGRFVALAKPGPAGPHKAAKDYCEALAITEHLGIRRWELPNPAVATKFAALGRKGRYWTSALWHGKALVVTFPTGHRESIAATERRPKALCVARWP